MMKLSKFNNIKNVFYFIVGILCILSAITHTLNGIQSSLPVINNGKFESNVVIEFNYLWHIIGAENLIFGIVLLIMAFHNKVTKSRIAIWLIMSILFIRWFIIIICTQLMGKINVSSLIIDSVVIFLIISLLILGLRKKMSMNVNINEVQNKKQII